MCLGNLWKSKEDFMKRIICTSDEDIIYQNLLEYISSKFKVNGPEYRGARQPEFHSLMVNESEFGDNLRYKSYVCNIVSKLILD